MKSALEGRIQRAEEIANTLKHFKREVALAAEHSKTGKPIAQKLLTDMEAKGGRVAHALAAGAGLETSHNKLWCMTMHAAAAQAQAPDIWQYLHGGHFCGCTAGLSHALTICR